MSDYVDIGALLGRTFEHVSTAQVTPHTISFLEPTDGGSEVSIGLSLDHPGKRLLDRINPLERLEGYTLVEAARLDIPAVAVELMNPDDIVCWTFIRLRTLAGAVHLRFIGRVSEPGAGYVVITER